MSFETDLENLCNLYGMEYGYTSIQKYRIENHYYTLHRDIWDSSEYWFEDVSVDFDLWFKHKTPLKDDLEITEDIANLLDLTTHHCTLAELPQEDLQMIEDWYEDLSYYDVVNDNSGIIGEFFGYGSYIDEYFNDIEALAYWTIYFEPRCFDEDVAHRCGLLPFTWKGEYELLALCGCGMDLSPKLDAYQALMSGTLPSDSQWFRQRDYFNYVSHIPEAEIEEACRRETPLVKMYAHGELVV